LEPAVSAKVVPLNNKRDWKWHRDRIAGAWGKQVESIIETGQCLIDAKEELDHGAFEAMVQSKLPFVPNTARRLKIIAEHEIISNRAHAHALPASWMTLYELTKLPPEILIAKLKDGSIHPKLERKDVRAMRPGAKDKPTPPTREELIAAIQKNPNANQRDAAEALGVSLGMYQRTRNELIGSGEINGALTIEDLRERLAALLRHLPKETRMTEINRTMKAVDLNIHDWVSTMTIGKKAR
jgi:hypothetical protein